jgi:hypothetical protein
VIVVGFLIALVVTAIVTLLFSLVVVALLDRSSLAAVLVVGLGGLVSLIVTTPFQAALLAVLYVDLRVRKEGFDIEQLAGRFGVDVEQPPDAPPPEAQAPEPADSAAPYWPAPSGPRPPTVDDEPAVDPGAPPPGWRPPG